MSEKPTQGPMSGKFETIQQTIYSNGAEHVYGVNPETHKKVHLSHEAVLANYGHSLDEARLQPELSVPAETSATDDPYEIAKQLVNRERQEAAVRQFVDVKDPQSMDDFSSYLNKRPAKPQTSKKAFEASKPDTAEGYEAKTMTELAKELAEAEVANDKTKFNDVDEVLQTKIMSHLEEVKSSGKSKLTGKKPNPARILPENDRETAANNINARLEKIQAEEKARLLDLKADIPKTPEKIDSPDDTIAPVEAAEAKEVDPETRFSQLKAQLRAGVAQEYIEEHGKKVKYTSSAEAQAAVAEIGKIIHDKHLTPAEAKKEMERLTLEVFASPQELDPSEARLNQLKSKLKAGITENNSDAYLRSAEAQDMVSEIKQIIKDKNLTQAQAKEEIRKLQEEFLKPQEKFYKKIGKPVVNFLRKTTAGKLVELMRPAKGAPKNGAVSRPAPSVNRTPYITNDFKASDELNIETPNATDDFKEETDVETTKSYEAVWKNEDNDAPVKIIGDAGKDLNGREYVYIEGTRGAIPKDEIFITDNFKVEKLKTDKHEYNPTVEIDKNGNFKNPKLNGHDLGTNQPEVISEEVREEVRDELESPEKEEKAFAIGEPVEVLIGHEWYKGTVQKKPNLRKSDGTEVTQVKVRDKNNEPWDIPVNELRFWQTLTEDEKYKKTETV